MTKKIIDVPSSADGLEITYTALTSTGDMTRFNKAAYSLDELEDAPKRRAVELPVDLIEDFEEDRWQYSDIREFLREVDIYSLSDAIQADPKDMFSTVREAAKVASEFYLGYVDLVPKKSHKFVVAVDMHDQYGNLQLAHAWKNNRHGGVTPYIDGSNLPSTYYSHMEFSEDEADKIVKGLLALHARKVQVEEP